MDEIKMDIEQNTKERSKKSYKIDEYCSFLEKNYLKQQNLYFIY